MKIRKKNGTGVTLNLSSNVFVILMIPHKFLLTNTQVSRLRKVFANN